MLLSQTNHIRIDTFVCGCSSQSFKAIKSSARLTIKTSLLVSLFFFIYIYLNNQTLPRETVALAQIRTMLAWKPLDSKLRQTHQTLTINLHRPIMCEHYPYFAAYSRNSKEAWPTNGIFWLFKIIVKIWCKAGIFCILPTNND